MQSSKYSHNTLLVVYHSINEYHEDRIRIPNIVTPAIFEAQIRYLVSTAQIISLEEFITHIKERKPLSRKSIVITFDDGYKDNLTTAAPVLRKYNVPATFFIATGYIGENKMKWEDRLSCLIRRSTSEVLSLELPQGEMTFNIASNKDKFRTIDALVNSLGYYNKTERLKVLDDLLKQTKAHSENQADIMMTWDDIRQLANTPGFSIGSHTVTHPHLARIHRDDVVFEVTNSKEHIENEINRPVTMFSYPYGNFNRDVIAILQGAGYASAGTIEYGQNNIYSDPFRLKRVLAPDRSGVSFSMGMRLRTSIFGELLRRTYSRIISRSRDAK